MRSTETVQTFSNLSTFAKRNQSCRWRSFMDPLEQRSSAGSTNLILYAFHFEAVSRQSPGWSQTAKPAWAFSTGIWGILLVLWVQCYFFPLCRWRDCGYANKLGNLPWTTQNYFFFFFWRHKCLKVGRRQEENLYKPRRAAVLNRGS